MSSVITAILPVYRDAQRAVAAADSLSRVAGSSAIALDILLVDDGSGDDTADQIAACLPEGARLLRLERNLGRSGARNAGAAAAQGDLLLFMDCDCVPAGADFISAHLRRLRQGAVASTGPVVGIGRGFWHAFQVRSSARRAALHGRGVPYAGSTQNLMVRRDCFEMIGGFDEAYRAYGFEDRDLLIRLAAHGPIAWANDALIEHHDDLSLAAVCRKMREAGAGGSGSFFSSRHPAAYRALGYASIDGKLHPVRGRFARAFSPLLSPAIAVTAAVLEQRWLPLALRVGLVRSLNGFSYLLGTTEAFDTRR